MLGCLWDLITWPFQLAGWFIGWILSAVGSLIGFAIGLAVCVAGAALCLTIIGAIIGVPMVIFGGGLMLKSIF